MKASQGFARRKLLAFLPVLALFLYVGGMAIAQMVADPCALYPHRSAQIPQGTPTAALVVGKLGYEIDVCRVSIESHTGASTPVAVTFYSGGEANASATPCATATTGGPGAVATQGAISAANTTMTIGGDGGHTLYHISPVSTGFPVDFCELMAGGTGANGSIDYVMIKP
jgi:hypothetical protein